jgi:IMP dehydrogenase
MLANFNSRIVGKGYTFDDVLLIPAASNVLPHETLLQSGFSEDFNLELPIISAAMDTVTEVAMAEAVARLGGLGVIHKNISAEVQSEMVKRVKRSESGIISHPLTIDSEKSVLFAKKLMEEKNISGLPVVNFSGELTGLLTRRDIRFESNENATVANAMTPVSRIFSLRANTDFASNRKDLISAATLLMHQHRVEKCPLVDDQGKLIGLITRRDIDSTYRYPNASKDTFGRLRVAAAVGVSQDDLSFRIPKLVEAEVDAIFVDTAHGHSQGVIQAVKQIVSLVPPRILVVAGNIATAEAAKALEAAGVHAVKVGIGPGSICTTRVVAGVGVPQLTAIMNVADALKNSSVKIIADGGLRTSGDIVKALAAGAHFVMAGSMFAGTEQAPGEKIILQGKVYKQYRGMGSLGAMKHGSKERYFQANVSEQKLVPEGIEGQVPYKGDVNDVVFQLIGGLRAGMGYLGCASLEDLRVKPQFIEITNAGLRESHVHNVTITQESPNYSSRNS